MEAIGHMADRQKKKIIPATITREDQRDSFIDFGNTLFVGSSVSVSGNEIGNKIHGCAGNEKSGTSKSSQGCSGGATSEKSRHDSKKTAGSSGMNMNQNDDDEGDGFRKKSGMEKFDGEETLTAEEVVEDDDEESEVEEVIPSSQISGRSARQHVRPNVENHSSDEEDASADLGADDEAEEEADQEVHVEPDGASDNGEVQDEEAEGRQAGNGDPATGGNFVWKTAKDINQETFPMKSKANYQEAYVLFQRFLKAQGRFVEGVCPSEEDILNYFSYLFNDRHLASSTIWCTSAKLNACLKREFGIKLQNFPCISELLKSFETGRVVKKAKIFSPQEVIR